MYKMVAIDLDGTLLNSYGRLSEYTKKVLKNMQNQNVEIVLASGRTTDSVKNFAEEMGASKYIIAGNGAIIYDRQKKQTIREIYIPKKKALNIINICEQNSISYSVYTDKSIIANSLKYNVLYYYKENIKKEESKKTRIKIVENIYEYTKNMENEHVMKISICDENKSVFNSILKRLTKIENIEVLDVSHMSRKIIKNGTQEVPIEYFYTEISNQNVNKWNSIKYLTNSLNISEEEIIAIGDNINDKKMVEQAGLGIAMKGCTPKLASVADCITDFDNNEDGVAKELEKIWRY